MESWRYGTMSISRSFSFPTPNNRLLAERSAGALPIIFNILACRIHLTLGWLCSEHTATPARGPPHSHPTLPTLNSTCCHHTNAYLEAPAPSHLSTVVAGRAWRQKVQYQCTNCCFARRGGHNRWPIVIYRENLFYMRHMCILWWYTSLRNEISWKNHF